MYFATEYSKSLRQFAMGSCRNNNRVVGMSHPTGSVQLMAANGLECAVQQPSLICSRERILCSKSVCR